MITFKEYKIKVNMTVSENIQNNSLYFVCGLVGEIGEFAADNSKIELGDCVWYWAKLCDFYHLDIDLLQLTPHPHKNNCFDLFMTASKIAEILKKEKRKSKLDRFGLDKNMVEFGRILKSIALHYEWNLADIMQMNIEKLQKRHSK